ncbi:MAG: glutathione S-transferase N-terminal domain-containing protein, partial [Pseudomonadota bacterium]
MSILANKRSIIVVYSNATDPYSQWVRIVLAAKGVTYEVSDAETPIHQQELRELNPYMSVPTLLDRDLVVYKAGIIVEYLDERFPHPPLMPVYPVARARSRLMIFRVERDWYTLMHRIQRGTLSEVEKARQELL